MSEYIIIAISGEECGIRTTNSKWGLIVINQSYSMSHEDWEDWRRLWILREAVTANVILFMRYDLNVIITYS
jgi:hypothetical protein